jgi:hypothetical protein
MWTRECENTGEWPIPVISLSSHIFKDLLVPFTSSHAQFINSLWLSPILLLLECLDHCTAHLRSEVHWVLRSVHTRWPSIHLLLTRLIIHVSTCLHVSTLHISCLRTILSYSDALYADDHNYYRFNSPIPQCSLSDSTNIWSYKSEALCSLRCEARLQSESEMGIFTALTCR